MRQFVAAAGDRQSAPINLASADRVCRGPFYQLQASDLGFGLTLRQRSVYGGADHSLVLGGAIDGGDDQAGSLSSPSLCLRTYRCRMTGVDVLSELSGLDTCGNTFIYRGDGDGAGLREIVHSGARYPGDGFEQNVSAATGVPSSHCFTKAICPPVDFDVFPETLLLPVKGSKMENFGSKYSHLREAGQRRDQPSRAELLKIGFYVEQAHSSLAKGHLAGATQMGTALQRTSIKCDFSTRRSADRLGRSLPFLAPARAHLFRGSTQVFALPCSDRLVAVPLQ